MTTPSDDQEPKPTPDEILTLQRLFLVHLLRNGSGCIDDITEADRLNRKYPGTSGNFRGGALAGLSGRKLIARTGELVVTRRPWRHCFRNPVWCCPDANRVMAFLRATDPARTD